MGIDLITSISDFICPPSCIGCRTPCRMVCKYCKFRRLNKVYFPRCHVCRKEARAGWVHSDCRNSTFLDGVCVAYAYNNFIEKIIIEAKYAFYHYILREVAELVFEQMRVYPSLKDPIITYVPAHTTKLKWRGFNQSELLCRYISEISGYQMVHVLERRVHTNTQVGLGRESRMQNLRSAFTTRSSELLVNNRPIIIVDDVMTTGSTLEYCAQSVREAAPGSEVYGLVFARGESG